MTRAEAKAKMRANEPILGTMCLEVTSPGLCRMLKLAGFDFVIFDTEHSWYGFETIARHIRSARDIGLLAIVRAPGFQGNWPARYLDIGADGILFPHVDNAAQAADIMRQVKYPPVGERGMANGIGHDDFSPQSMREFTEQANEEILVIMQIETATGLKNRDEILSTPGLDAVFIGPQDLSLSMGFPGMMDQPEVKQAMEDILDSAKQHNVIPGLHCFSVQNTRHWISRGACFVTHRADISFMIEGPRQDLAKIRA